MERQDRQERQARQEPPAELDSLATVVIDAAFKVHKVLGQGLLESAYERFLVHELGRRGVRSRTQVAVPATFEGLTVDTSFRLDLLVDEVLVVEIKAVEALSRLHHAQLLTYLRLSNYPLGLLINFNVRMFRDGVRRIIP